MQRLNSLLEDQLMSEPWVPVKVVAKHLRVAEMTVYRWIKKRGLPANRIGRLWKFKVSEVDEWVRSGGAIESDDEKSIEKGTAHIDFLETALKQNHLQSVFDFLHTNRPEPAIINQALQSSIPSVVHAAILHVWHRLKEPSPEQKQEDWVQLLPREIALFPAETQRLLAEVWIEIPVYYPLPNWRSADLAPEVFVTWLRAQIVHSPKSTKEFPTDFALRAAISNIPIDKISTAQDLVENLLKSSSSAIQRQGIRYLDQAFSQGIIKPSVAHDLLTTLLDDPNAMITVEAIKRLRSPWATLIPQCPQSRLLSLIVCDFVVAREAILTLTARGESESLVPFLETNDVDPYVQRVCIDALAEYGEKRHIHTILERALCDLLFFGESAIQTLLMFRRRGIVCSKEQAAAVFGIYIESLDINEEDVAEILSPYVAVCLEGIEVVLSSPQPQWDKVVNLLAAFSTKAAVDKLKAIVGSDVFKEGWAPAIRALGNLQIADAEEMVLERFLDEPDAGIEALIQMGASTTVSRLKTELFHQPAEVKPAWHYAAARLLYQLEPGSQNLKYLSNHGLLSGAILDSLPTCASIAETRTLGNLAHQPGHPLREHSIRGLGHTAGIHGISLLARCLDDSNEKIRQITHEAIQNLGGRLYRFNVLRPACLVLATSEEEAGSLLLADCLLTRLDDQACDDQQLLWFLETLTEHAHPHLLRRIRKLLRHRNPHVIKFALQCLGTHGKKKAVPWILPFAETKDIYILRQALLALGNLQAHWAAPTILKSLEHPNMNIKKTAIVAMRGTKCRSIIPKLLFWVSHHDNPGFRQELVSVLKASLENDFVTVVATALDLTTKKRSWELLCLALNNEISTAFVTNKIQHNHPWTKILLLLIYSGSVYLKDGDVVSLEAELRQRGLEKCIPETFDAPTFATYFADSMKEFDFAKTVAQLHHLLEQAPQGVEPNKDIIKTLTLVGLNNGTNFHLRKLRYHVHQLIDMCGSLNKDARHGVLSILLANANTFSEVETLRTAWIAKDLWDEFQSDSSGKAISDIGAVLTVQQARQLLASEQFSSLNRAVNTILWASHSESELGRLLASSGSRVLSEFIEVGRQEQCFKQACKDERVLDCVSVINTVKDHYGNKAAINLTRRLLRKSDLASRHMSSLLPRFEGTESDGLLADISSNKKLSINLRTEAISALSKRPSNWNRSVLKKAVEDKQAEIRMQAASGLYEWSNSESRTHLLDKYIDGKLGEHFTDLKMKRSEVRHVAKRVKKVKGKREDQELVRILELLPACAFHTQETINILVGVWEKGLNDSSAMARNILRGVPIRNVLPAVYPRLSKNIWAYLDILGTEQKVDSAFLKLFKQADANGKNQLLRYLYRKPDMGPFYSPGLGDALLSFIKTNEEIAKPLAILSKLTDWYEPESALRLVKSLQEVMKRSPKQEKEVIDAILLGSHGQSAALQIKLFRELGLGCVTKYPTIMTRIAEAQIDEPNTTVLLTNDTRVAITNHIRNLISDKNPELARKVVTYLARTQSPEETMDLLEEMLSHRSTRVRLQSHRMLQRTAPRERYLQATAQLLSDTNPDIIRRAVRVLTFGGDTDSLKKIIGLLHHKERTVRRAAHQGLVVMGELAVPPLHRALNQERPDRRDVIRDILTEITGVHLNMPPSPGTPLE
jgi:excisionase family DNA binding protein